MLPRNDPDRIQITFDDHRLVANAGLLLPTTLAQHLGLRELVDNRVDLGAAPRRANSQDTRCYHWSTPTASKSLSTTTAWWPMLGYSFRSPSPSTWVCVNSSTVTLTSEMRRAGRTRETRL